MCKQQTGHFVLFWKWAWVTLWFTVTVFFSHFVNFKSSKPTKCRVPQGAPAPPLWNDLQRSNNALMLGRQCMMLGHLMKDLNEAISLVVAPKRWPYVAMWETSKDGGYHDLLIKCLTVSEIFLITTSNVTAAATNINKPAERDDALLLCTDIDSPTPQSVYPSLLAPWRAV